MQLTLKDDLPFTRVTVAYRGAALTIAILGMDFLTRAGAIINLRDLHLDFAP